jgi:hypothetical protein
MKKLAIVQKIVSFVLFLLLFGCGSIPVTETVEKTASEKTLQTPSTRAMTATVVVSSTETPAPELIATATPYPMEVNPYSEEEMEWIIQNAPLGYLSCEFPCFLGVQPGVTVFDDANEIVRRHGLVFFEVIEEKTEIKYYDNFGVFSLRLSLKRDPRDGLVQNLSLLIMDPTGKNKDAIKEKLIKYSPERIIAHYGVPDRISIFIPEQQWTGRNEKYYYLILFYENLGVRIDYGGTGYNNNYQQEICPSWASLDSGFSLGINETQSGLPLTVIPHMLAIGSEFPEYEYPVTEYLGITVEEFVIEYVLSSEESCFILDYE